MADTKEPKRETRVQKNDILDPKVPDDALCTIGDLMKLLGFTRVTVWRWKKDGLLPKPLEFPNRNRHDALLWRVGDIRDWGRKAGLIKTL